MNGEARVTVDATPRERLAVEGRLPISVLVVSVKSAFMRSKLWKSETWPDRDALPTLSRIFRDQLAVDDIAEQDDRRLDQTYKETLW